MRVDYSILWLLAGLDLSSSLSIRSKSIAKDSISERDASPEPGFLEAGESSTFDEALLSYLEKRRGGGGSGGGGGRGGSGSSGSGSSGSGSSGSGSSGSGSSGSGSSGSGSSGSGSGGSAGGAAAGGGGAAGGSRNTGTASSSSSVGPSFGGGRFYGGGSSTAYRSGGRSPGAGIVPLALIGGVAGAALIFPGLWLYGAYNYPYNHPYSYHNASNHSQPANVNETLPVTCLCQMYSACGCDDNGNSTYLDGILGNGSLAAENSSLVHVGDVNGTKTIVLNGTLPNGTDTSAAPSGTPTATSGAVARAVVEGSGFWVLGGVVGGMVWLL